LKCAGCGAELQFEDPEKPGYIPYEVFQRKLAEGGEILCRRCFRMKHYGVYEPVKMDSDFTRELKNVLGSFELVIWVIDITDFEGTYRPELKELLKGKKVIYAVTKTDLMPRTLSKKEMKEWLKRRIKTRFSQDIRLVSGKTGFGLNSLKKHILSSGYDKALVIGVTNVGKSSLVNKLVEAETVVSPFPGTTLGLMRRKMKEARFYLYDTPGILVGDRAIDLLSPECQAEILNSKELTRKTFKLGRDRAILIGGMAVLRVDFEGDLRPIFQVFTHRGVKLHETKYGRVDELLRKRVGDLLVPPCFKSELNGIDWKEEEHEVTEKEEVVIAGLGWINVKRGPVMFKIRVPKSVKTIVRERLIVPRR